MYEQNFFNHNKPLDDFFRGKDLDSVKMNCVKCALKNVVKNNYGHHIERLMIIGNFALLY
jgi:deoxyribodipyrimidine photolyase-related protein